MKVAPAAFHRSSRPPNCPTSTRHLYPSLRGVPPRLRQSAGATRPPSLPGQHICHSFRQPRRLPRWSGQRYRRRGPRSVTATRFSYRRRRCATSELSLHATPRVDVSCAASARTVPSVPTVRAHCTPGGKRKGTCIT